MKTALLATALALLTPLAAQTGKTFEVLLLPSIQYAHRDIYFHTPQGRGPQFSMTQDVVRGQRIDLLPLFHGYQVDADGKAHVTYDVVLHRPDGKTESAATSAISIDRKEIDPQGIIYPRDLMSLTPGHDDPLGEWRFELVGHDHIGGRKVTGSIVVRVIADDPLSLPGDFDPGKWLMGYCDQPSPRLALPALIALCETPEIAQKPAEAHGTTLGFYERILSDNPWLVPRFKDRLVSTSNPLERRMLALVLVYAGLDGAEFEASSPPAAAAALAEARREKFPRPSREPMTGGQLDVWWGRFFATGRYEPIHELVQVLQYHPHRDAIENHARLARKPRQTPPEVYKSAVFRSAVWSLSSNAQRSPLVRAYCESIFQRETLEPEVRALLAAVLRSAVEAPVPSSQPAMKTQ